MQAAEEEAQASKSQLGSWAVLDSFRLNHVHGEKAVFTNAATAEPVQLELSFLKHGDIQVEVSAESLKTAPANLHVAYFCKTVSASLFLNYPEQLYPVFAYSFCCIKQVVLTRYLLYMQKTLVPGEGDSAESLLVCGAALHSEDSSVSAEINGQRLSATYSLHCHADQQVISDVTNAFKTQIRSLTKADLHPQKSQWICWSGCKYYQNTPDDGEAKQLA